ncbi:MULTISPECIES: MFS transporter [unclassified Mycolicibacterium]|uniref:MFS transporter n=1 Tax=unclassified Mycolicibacterium TaxID=2636767 RepID=UPI0012DDE3C3|nr:MULTISPECIES: MFS transporter [unclassified Mycolicibacterium]MUL85493.1 MFS transporter [Mycolicibacterium sp. CBMA 329]MUL88743.1 MFS transporter [Mycolicibacterium sp. CBMA 331]MUM01963.1 MFS transporter [Mycolicibacterium sp. CBMA 334]MUM29233.1 MFS transporter [Mycolicibacterium sp. CBMA 295]MUM40390.1 MFS transporter [Mycolicibacterium sp. CBMA 247]
MSHAGHLIDDAPLTSFHKKLTLFSSGGPFIDGYALSIIGVALITLEPAMGLTSTEIGLVGAASLIGIFVGGGLFGYITDKVGRHLMYIADLVALAVFSVMSAFAGEAWQIIALRFLLGVAIGADYPIATSLLAEFLPKKQRGRMLGAMFVVWAVGAAAAYIVGFLLRDFGPDAWRLLLASPAIFAVITLLARMGTPESPRWLLSKGRVAEADAAIKQTFGQQFGVADLAGEGSGQTPATSFTQVFKRPYLNRTIFVAVFWTAQVIPLFAVYTFAPDLLASFGLHGDANLYGGSLLISLLFVVGGLPGLYLVERIGRRPLLIGSFAIIVLALAIPALIPGVPPVVFFLALAVYAVTSGASSFLEIVYPNELFPTEVRATAVGVGTAVSRIGSAGGTYLMPLALTALGAGGALGVGAAVTAVGLVVSIFMAPETKGVALTDNATLTDDAPISEQSPSP